MRKRTEATSQRVKKEGRATSPVGRVEGVANDRSIHEAVASYSVRVPGHKACEVI